jgi:hypothetical protein
MTGQWTLPLMRYLRAAAAALALVGTLTSCGCYYLGRDDYDDILQKPFTEWTPREDLTVIIACTRHNVHDPMSSIKIFSLPYYPSVVVASIRVWEDRAHVSDQEFVRSADELARANAGLYIDWEKKKFVDGRGNYFKGPLQLDSLMFMVHLENWGWPPRDISDIEKRIILVNDRQKFIRPRYVWGRRQNELWMPENLLVMFTLRSEGHHFLDGSQKMYLVVKGFDTDIRYAYDLSWIR